MGRRPELESDEFGEAALLSIHQDILNSHLSEPPPSLPESVALTYWEHDTTPYDLSTMVLHPWYPNKAADSLSLSLS